MWDLWIEKLQNFLKTSFLLLKGFLSFPLGLMLCSAAPWKQAWASWPSERLNGSSSNAEQGLAVFVTLGSRAEQEEAIQGGYNLFCRAHSLLEQKEGKQLVTTVKLGLDRSCSMHLRGNFVKQCMVGNHWQPLATIGCFYDCEISKPDRASKKFQSLKFINISW